MSDPADLKRLTSNDHEQHERMIAWLKRRLLHSCEAFTPFFEGPLRVIGPSVRVYWEPATGVPQRELQLGGLEWDLKFPEAEGLRQVHLKHWPPGSFWLHATFGRWHTPAQFTRFSLTVEPASLGRVLSGCLAELKREAAPIVPIAREKTRLEPEVRSQTPFAAAQWAGEVGASRR